MSRRAGSFACSLTLSSNLRSISILSAISLALLVLALPPFSPKNLFRLTSSRLQILTEFGPKVLASCSFCVSNEPKIYLYYALPSLLAPRLLNLVIFSLATSATVAGNEAAR
ncbi:hypothetical protein F4782DRAFT_534536 [Xylaria castorea]|nr:hypothetical protein F4782DRAFT_534536 [Xylaria castorea]